MTARAAVRHGVPLMPLVVRAVLPISGWIVPYGWSWSLSDPTSAISHASMIFPSRRWQITA